MACLGTGYLMISRSLNYFLNLSMYVYGFMIQKRKGIEVPEEFERRLKRWSFTTLLRAAILVLAALVVAVFAIDSGAQSISSQSEGQRPLPTQQATLAISPKVGLSWQGFGASGAWWPGPVSGFSQAAKDQLGRVLFSRSGLYLAQYRYNIGGGGVGVIVPWKAPPTFYVGPGKYNWSADHAGVEFLKMANRYHVPDLVGFVNSAPTRFTTNHLSCGGSLNPFDVSSYATYLAQVIQGIKLHFGVTINYVSPMNEPDNNFGSCKQEGMAVPVSLRSRVVIAVGKALAKYAPWCKELADESSKVSTLLLPHLDAWANNPATLKYLAVVAHHLYDFPNSTVLSKMATKIASLHKPSWMTEICCYNGAHFGYQYDPTMVSGMWLAHTIYSDITYGRDRAFDWWTAVSPNLGCDPKSIPGCWDQVNYLGRNDGLAYYDISGAKNGDQNFYLTKRYFVFGNYSRFIRPGAKIHFVQSDSSNVFAIASKTQNTWTVVVGNESSSSTPMTLEIDFPNTRYSLVPTKTIVTDVASSWQEGNLPEVKGGTAIASIPPNSVTTFIFQSKVEAR